MQYHYLLIFVYTYVLTYFTFSLPMFSLAINITSFFPLNYGSNNEKFKFASVHRHVSLVNGEGLLQI
jgi:hypothetical protein